MSILNPTVAAVLAGLSLASPALASSSDWYETQGGRIRLVTSGVADANGQLSGILDIELQPGWKTYWRDPGDAGVPPSLDVAASRNVSGASMDFPPPQRHDDGNFKWAGYDRSVALPIAFAVKSPDDSTMIEAKVFLGICETICVPVQATLTLDPANDADNADDAAAVMAAREALPAPAQPDFGISVVSQPGDTTLVVKASFPGDPQTAELFIASADGYTFTTPQRSAKDGNTLFSTHVSMPARLGIGPGLHYTLVTNAGAVSGLLPYM